MAETPPSYSWKTGLCVDFVYVLIFHCVSSSPLTYFSFREGKK